MFLVILLLQEVGLLLPSNLCPKERECSMYESEMGIPSYFRRVLQKYPGCLSKTVNQTIDSLCFDFNCLIYRCLRSPSLRPFPSDLEDQDAWENELLQNICACVREVWSEAGRPKKVYLAVDGVVPMAKIRQQRVRRFKSAWLRKGSTGFDSNALTPGTRFMERLCRTLRDLSAKHVGWEVSDVHEHGEGEHKILQWLRKNNVKGKIAVYGLDADLILLSMLVAEQVEQTSLWLLREAQEFGGKPQTAQGKQEYQWLDLAEFKKRLGLEGKHQVLNYIALMSLMGNDFLPHSVTHKLNDDGYEYVMDEVQKGTLIVNPDGILQLDALRGVFQRWSVDEADKLKGMIQKKQSQAKRGVLQGMEPQEGLPLEWNVEAPMLKHNILVNDWKALYWTWIHPTEGRAACKRVCEEYLFGCQWILDYYLGKPVDFHWMFPAWIPPLWSDLVQFSVMPERVRSEAPPPTPEEQLAMVLPLESWGLVTQKTHRMLPVWCPQMWPLHFTFFSFGRKWLWECEARIPPLTAGRLREILNEH